jgi:release factor glutamine methyltransferase
LITISQALRESVEILSSLSETPNLDAQILLANILGKPRAWIISHPEYPIPPSETTKWKADLNSLAGGIPLPHIIGHWEFYGLQFKVTPDTLIPRPESEIIVEEALEWLGGRQGTQSAVDIGTGSGCIAVSITRNSTGVITFATDISFAALEVAASNAKLHCVHDQVSFIQADLFPPLKIAFDLICANLPYIPTEDLHQLEVFGREPGLALDGGAQGLTQIARLLEIAPAYTNFESLLLVEIEHTQGDQVQSIARQQFPAAEISLVPDLSGRDRVLKIQTSGFR